MFNLSAALKSYVEGPIQALCLGTIAHSLPSETAFIGNALDNGVRACWEDLTARCFESNLLSNHRLKRPLIDHHWGKIHQLISKSPWSDDYYATKDIWLKAADQSSPLLVTQQEKAIGRSVTLDDATRHILLTVMAY